MNYTPNEWNHGDVITANLLNKLEQAVKDVASNAYISTQYDYIQSTELVEGDYPIGSDNNKISTKQSVARDITAAINALDKTINLTDSSGVTLDTDNPDYRRVLSSITQTDGKLASVKYVQIPIAATNTLGLVKVGTHLTIENGILSGNYNIDTEGGAYSSANKLATVGSVTTAINALDAIFVTSPSASKTLTALAQTNGIVSATFADISIASTQVNDVHIDGTVEASGTYQNKYIIPTMGTVNTAISTAAPVTMTSAPASGTDTRPAAGLISKTAYDKLDNLDSISSLTEEQQAARDAALANETEWTDPRPQELGLFSTGDRDTLDWLSNIPVMASAPELPNVDERPSAGYISKTDKDKLDSINTSNLTLLSTLLSNITISNGNITGIKVHDAAGENYKVLTYDEIDTTGIPVQGE